MTRKNEVPPASRRSPGAERASGPTRPSTRKSRSRCTVIADRLVVPDSPRRSGWGPRASYQILPSNLIHKTRHRSDRHWESGASAFPVPGVRLSGARAPPTPVVAGAHGLFSLFGVTPRRRGGLRERKSDELGRIFKGTEILIAFKGTEILIAFKGTEILIR